MNDETTTVDLEAVYANSKVQDTLGKLDEELVGLGPVTTRIREIAALLLVDRLRLQLDLQSGPPAST